MGYLSCHLSLIIMRKISAFIFELPFHPVSEDTTTTSVPMIILYVSGAVILLLFILGGLTICYRRKLAWMERLDRFRRTHDSRREDNENQL